MRRRCGADSACLVDPRKRSDDGTSEECDALNAATGYSVEFPLLEPALLGNQDTILPLYKRVVPPDLPALFFVGYFNLDWASNPRLRAAGDLRNIELGTCDLPSPREMWNKVQERRRMIETNFHNAMRPYLRELKQAQRFRDRHAA